MGVMRRPISHFLAVYNNWCCVSQIHQRTPFCKFLHSVVAELPKGSGETRGEMFITGFIYWRKQLSHLVGGSQRRSETRRSPSALDLNLPSLLVLLYVCHCAQNSMTTVCLPSHSCRRGISGRPSAAEGRGGCLHRPSLPEVYAGGTAIRDV